jgi:hypothetical protein
MPLVFVSHATADSAFVEEFVEEVLKGCGLSEQQIFVSSMPGMGVAAGRDLLAEVRATVGEAKLVVAVVTPTYPTRPVCVAELGAAWGVVGKLHPVLAPGVDRESLDGALAGLKADYLNEEHALDELQQRIEDETGVRPESTPSWTRKKQRWLRRVADLAAALPVPTVVSADEYEALLQQIKDLRDALGGAESEIDALQDVVERLRAAKDADEVAEILLPSDDIDRFKALQSRAASALKGVSRAVRETIRCGLSGDEMRWPNKFDDPDLFREVEDALASGHLVDGGDTLDIDTRYGVVRRAEESTRALAAELGSDRFEPEFFEWFEREFDGPAELGSRSIWERVFPYL